VQDEKSIVYSLKLASDPKNLRYFSKKPKDLREAYKTVRTRMEKLPKVISLAKTQEIAAQRLQEMESLLAAFEEESFGCY
jgi:hypothetical protein